VSHHELHSRGPGDASTAGHPVLSIGIRRERATVVVTLEGFLDEDGAPALAALLWDLVVGQGNLSVAVDAARLTLSDPVLIWIFQALQRETALRGGNLAVGVQGLGSAALEQRRARRLVALSRAAHPAGSASTKDID
jgi:hypothetical protein